ncbi:T9SS type B sorting domain-containing protein [Kordia periserrulae]|uniref:T9SS type B sorting domain-containing protein n=1 Tax=Kordia periserrulae TaxID=701523 RepID=UPI000D33CD65|nr:gliding motility-associated C-terminal domain-containing protein [Kordia periserrulae]
MRKKYLTILFLFCYYVGWTQTTDISASLEATDLNGTPISNIIIFQEFYYVTTVSNSGNDVSNVTFSQQLAPSVVVLSIESQNAVGGAADATNFVYNADTDTVTASLPNLPNASSVEIRIRVRAPKFSGGISTTATVTPPNGTTDTSPSGNTSVISMDVTYTPLDFSVTYQQVNPASGTGISAWGDQVTFEFTITNNSAIQYPIDDFGLFQGLASNSLNGSATLQLLSLNCIAATNGVVCPTNFTGVPGTTIGIVPIQEIYQYDQEIIFPSQSSLTFRAVFEYTEGDCGIESELIRIQSFAEVTLTEPNTNSDQSNIEITDLLDSTICPCTDVTIATDQIVPAIGTIPNYGDQVTYQTVLTNNGPLDTTIQFFFQNLGINWEFVSINCVSATGGVTCSDLNFDIDTLFWEVDSFFIPAGAVIVIETTVAYNEPICPTDSIIDSPYRTTVNMLQHIDCNVDDNNDFDSITLPQAPGTVDCVTPDSIVVTKTQVDPVLPLGSSEDNPIPWGDITYHITVANNNLNEIPLTLVDFYGGDTVATGILQSVTCIETTGTAACIPTPNTNIGVELTMMDEVFWEITEAENWVLPAESSITFEVVVNWNPQCSSLVVPVTNTVSTNITGLADSTITVEETSYLTSCVDLIIQTYPSQATTPVNSNFNWIVDITNSITSSTATDAIFSTAINPAFTIAGTPTCTVTSGNATCISSFAIDTTTNEVSGIIPLLDPDATIQIIIPVTAPNFGGSFTNIAEIQPDPANNTEANPSTNVSISSVQVLSPTLTKAFSPEEITELETSLLTFTIENIPGNLAQSGISFTDNLPVGIVLAGEPFWVENNGATADFVGATDDDFVGVNNLVIPDGVASCSFAVLVTSDTSGFYTNEFANFSNLTNIDASTIFATLNVLPIPPTADLSIEKVVDIEMPSFGDSINFTITITNNSTNDASNIIVEELLPDGYEYDSHTASAGTYDEGSQLWTIDSLAAGNSATLTLTVTVVDGSDYVNVVEIINQSPVDENLDNNSASAETFPDCIEIPSGFSPNNDLFNDFWEIRCLENYADNELTIFNRWGTIVYKTRNYANNWNGEANQNTVLLNSSGRLPVGTYFYVLKLQGNTIEKTGWVYLSY